MSEKRRYPESVNIESLFEHIFPGNSWSDLRKFDLRNAAFFAGQVMSAPFDDAAEIGHAAKTGMGYSSRLEIPHPDRSVITWALADVSAAEGNSSLVRGWLQGLLRRNEHLGGLGLRQVNWLKFAHSVNTQAALSAGQEFYDTATAMVVGVLSSRGQPAALITFTKGR